MKTEQWWHALPAAEITPRVTGAVCALFAPPEWATFLEVDFRVRHRDRWQSRRADVFAVHCWHTHASGSHAEMIEVKASRQDLKSEMDDPTKGDITAAYAVRRWIAYPIGLADGIEIPPIWGTIEVGENGGARRTRRPAADTVDPRPLPHSIVASMARRMASHMYPQDALGQVMAQRPGIAWSALWRYAGRDLDFAQLIELSQAAWEGTRRGKLFQARERARVAEGKLARILREHPELA